jgi:hypothetical protein
VKLENLSRGEWIAMLGGLILGISVFLPSYGADSKNPNATLNSGKGGVCGDGTCSYFQTHTISRWLLLLAAAAPFILAWIIIREHELSWPRGQVTSVTAIAAIGFIGYFGLVDRPGEPSGAISLKIGFLGMLVGAGLMLAGSVMRQQETEVQRKPPGTL